MQNFTYSDIGYLFKKHPTTKDILVKYDVDAVRQALTILFMTNNYEKRFDAEFGVGITGMMFENITPLTKHALLKKIQYQVDYYEPRVVIDDLEVNTHPDSNTISVNFYFHAIANQNAKEILTLSFERIR